MYQNKKIKNSVILKTFLTGLFIFSIMGCSSSDTKNVNEDNSVGIEVSGSNNTKTNSSTIDVSGKNSIGMLAKNKGTAINNGTINVTGNQSIGMFAESGGKIINNGTINVGKESSFAMKATGEDSYIHNNGDIKIDKSHSSPSSADISVELGATFKNSGNIEVVEDLFKSSSDTLSINTDLLSFYVIGTSENGDYGKIKAQSVSINGNLKIDTSIAKGEFKDKYLLSSIIDSTNVTLGDKYTFSSTSLLYDAHYSFNTSGGLDAELTKNNNTLSMYTEKDYVSIANIFDKYIDKDAILTLDSEQKNVINKIFEKTTDNKSINRVLTELSGNIYSNIARQIFDTNDVFTNKEVKLIENLGENKYVFSALGNINKNTSKYGIEGYKSELSGFLGIAELSENLFGTFGYGYNKINYDYSGSGTLQSIHTGLYKYYTIDKVKLKIGLNGEYNFHETDRNIYFLEKKANSDFNSYLIGMNSEISRKYGDSLYIEPMLGLNVAYSSQDSFSETKADSVNLKIEKENYTSIKPNIGIEIGKKFSNIDFYASSKYLYELGDMDKTRQMSFENFSGEFQSISDFLKGSSTELKLGTSIHYDRIGFNVNIGKIFGKREKEFVNAEFVYKF